MRELALHVLDLIENSLAAGALQVLVRVVQDRKRDALEIVVEDDGRGLSVKSDRALDPFFTTKPGKRTGLGLSLFREAAERAGGGLSISTSSLGGLAVRATMSLGHIDRMPLGDMAATLGAIACTAPEVDLLFELVVDGRAARVSTKQLRGSTGCGDALAVMRRLSRDVRRELDGMGVVP